MSDTEPQETGLSSSAASQDVIKYLNESIEGTKASATFACGGIIPIKNQERTDSSTSPNVSLIESPSSPSHNQLSLPAPSRDHQHGSPVHLFWSKDDGAPCNNIVFPLSGQSTDSNMERLLQLVADCEPASFGRGQQDILDPEYRRAGKLDSNRFASSFHPADYGLIETVEQLLLPAFNTSLQNKLPFRKLSAELYKLNIYSGPAGLFRKHVDTPRSKSQIGSLVVCFPSPFRGGDLVVRHNGKDVEFKWDAQSEQAIQWAAFYSDCEHEIKTITDGHRITLTYNLYVTEPVIQPAIQGSLVDVQTLPLYGYLKGLLADPTFMRDGGLMGIWCAHSYPHTATYAVLHEGLFPQGLKGSDLMLYAIFESLEIRPDVLPIFVLDRDKYDISDSSFEQKVFIASRLSSLQFDQYHGCDPGVESSEQLFEGWPGAILPLKEILWISYPKHEQLGLAYLDYGNEASIHTKYSFAAIIADVPSFESRQKV